MTPELATHLRSALARMAEAQALAFVRSVFSVPGRSQSPTWRSALQSVLDPRAVRLLTAAIEAAPRGEREHVLRWLVSSAETARAPELARAQDEARLTLMGVLSHAELIKFFDGFQGVLLQRPAKEGLQHVRAVLEKARTLGENERSAVLQNVLNGSHEYEERVLVPLAESAWDWLDETERRLLLEMAAALRKSAQHAGLSRQVSLNDAAAAILKPHLRELADLVNYSEVFNLKDDPRRYPVHLWLPLLPDGWAAVMGDLNNFQFSITSADADEAARRMLERSGPVSRVVLSYVRHRCSPEIGAKVFDAELRSEDPLRRGVALSVLPPSGAPAHAAALEDLIERELASEPPDLGRLRQAGRILLNLKPSAKLFPVARALLESEDADNVLAGIQMAASLGQGDLLADLKPHLASMNSKLRVAAGKAVAAIQAIAALEYGVPGK